MIELMVAITIGLILLAGVIQVYLGNKQSYNTIEAYSRLQENGRFAVDFITRDLREAAYYGCHGSDDVTNIMDPNPPSAVDRFFLSEMDQGVGGFEATTSSSWSPDPIAAGADPGDTASGFDVDLSTGGGSDILYLRGPLTVALPLTTDMVNTTSDVEIAAGSGLAPNDILLTSDCEAGVLFQLTSTASEANDGTLEHATGGSSPGNTTNDLARIYRSGSGEVHGMGTALYYVADDEDGMPSLFRRVNTGNAMALVSGVENLQIVYGVDDDGDFNADLYVDADTVESTANYEWGEVVSVRMALLLRTLDTVKPQAEAKTYCLLGDPSSGCAGGTEIATNDAFLRQVFNTTVMLRNRVRME